VKKSIEDNKFTIQDGCNHRGRSRLHSLNFRYAIFNPILSQTLTGAGGSAGCAGSTPASQRAPPEYEAL
jgi:hypothetical protein